MSNCDLLGLLVTAQYSQVFFIYRSNDYGQNLLLARGTREEIFADEDWCLDVLEHVNDPVDYWTIREDGAMFIRLRMQEKVEELYSGDQVKKWERFDPSKRPWLFTAEMDDFTNTIHGESKLLHPYGKPKDGKKASRGKDGNE